METGALEFLYRFTLSDGTVREFHARMDRLNMRLLSPTRERYPEWTRLSFEQCPNCPLDENACPRCPVAAHLVDLVDAFGDRPSTEKARIEIVSKQRTIHRDASLAEGVSALMGIYMSTGGCPILDLLKPNVIQHLPFASADETLFRTLSMYLLAQHFVARRGGKPDWALEKFSSLIDEVHTVNKKFCDRLHGTCLRDVHVNALTHLDCFAEIARVAVSKKPSSRLDALEQLFEAYLPHDLTLD
ncbi:MAG: hypothetical protein WCU88_03770 [Elusimicrobiota bacterium]